MTNKPQMPRMKIQDKDNAVKVTKNAPAKAELKNEKIRAKIEEEKEQAQNRE